MTNLGFSRISLTCGFASCVYTCFGVTLLPWYLLMSTTRVVEARQQLYDKIHAFYASIDLESQSHLDSHAENNTQKCNCLKTSVNNWEHAAILQPVSLLSCFHSPCHRNTSSQNSRSSRHSFVHRATDPHRPNYVWHCLHAALLKGTALYKDSREECQSRPLSAVRKAFFQERFHIFFPPPACSLLCNMFLMFCISRGKTTQGYLASLGSATDLQLPPTLVLHLQIWKNCILRSHINLASL